jgi:hypothetical protein
MVPRVMREINRPDDPRNRYLIALPPAGILAIGIGA